MSVHAPEPDALRSSPHELPALRLLPVPVGEPPYDDELPPRLHLLRGHQARTVGPLRTLVPLRLVPAEDEAGVVTPPVELPAVRPPAQALVQGLLEVLAGVRPVSQLKRATTTELFDEIEARVHAARRPSGPRPRTGAVRSLHVQERGPVAEVCATVSRGGRATALALRFEHTDGRWRCVELAGL